MSGTGKIIRNFYASGKLSSESEMDSRGVPDGFYREYFENGHLKSEVFSASGRRNGKCRQWREDGSLLGESLLVNGTGTYIVWYESGEKKFEMELVDGLFHGTRKLFDLNGKCVLTEYFVRGRKATKRKLLESRETGCG
jgi:antitoxin component YwqK of YwqJK toxin-antitoxin module